MATLKATEKENIKLPYGRVSWLTSCDGVVPVGHGDIQYGIRGPVHDGREVINTTTGRHVQN